MAAPQVDDLFPVSPRAKARAEFFAALKARRERRPEARKSVRLAEQPVIGHQLPFLVGASCMLWPRPLAITARRTRAMGAETGSVSLPVFAP